MSDAYIEVTFEDFETYSDGTRYFDPPEALDNAVCATPNCGNRIGLQFDEDDRPRWQQTYRKGDLFFCEDCADGDLPTGTTIHVAQAWVHPTDPSIGFTGPDGAVFLHFQNDDHIIHTIDQLTKAMNRREAQS